MKDSVTNVFKRIMVDPPSGWLYGFPMVLDKPEDMLFKDWLILKGYPAKDAEWAAENTRTWSEAT